VPCDVELLITEEHDAMLVQGIADLADGLVVEVPGNVDAGNLGATGAGEQTNLETRIAHRLAPSCCRGRGYSNGRAFTPARKAVTGK